ncbi:MAG: hypothetical protein KGM97_06700 [Alphaproteobacteria bacterium]|nr:hypothetical protein [Alphaproteobacteria bacterium]MDE2630663.1 hypothetical protein [Alphaproteobacteria bacterium]
MFNRIFPKQFDNTYRGHWLAIWLFVPVVLMELAMGANSIINTRTVAMSADGIPLDRYGAGGADAVIALFAIAGLFRVLLALQGIVVLIRYRAMIPFMYLLLLIVQLGSKALVLVHPIVRSGVSTAQLGSAFILAILAMTVIGVVLSLRNKSDSPGSLTAPLMRS